eukprot:1160534-Pelagomonas_calceolata.AAC.31
MEAGAFTLAHVCSSHCPLHAALNKGAAQSAEVQHGRKCSETEEVQNEASRGCSAICRGAACKQVQHASRCSETEEVHCVVNKFASTQQKRRTAKSALFYASICTTLYLAKKYWLGAKGCSSQEGQSRWKATPCMLLHVAAAAAVAKTSGAPGDGVGQRGSQHAPALTCLRHAPLHGAHAPA